MGDGGAKYGENRAFMHVSHYPYFVPSAEDDGVVLARGAVHKLGARWGEAVDAALQGLGRAGRGAWVPIYAKIGKLRVRT